MVSIRVGGRARAKGNPGRPSRIAADIVDIGRRWTEMQAHRRRNWSPWVETDRMERPGCSELHKHLRKWHLRCVIDATSSDSDRVFDFDLEDSLISTYLSTHPHRRPPGAVVRRAGEKLEHADVMAIIRRAMENERKGKAAGPDTGALVGGFAPGGVSSCGESDPAVRLDCSSRRQSWATATSYRCCHP